MNRSIKIEILESPAKLKKMYRSETDKRKSERLQFLYLLKTSEIKSLSQGAKILMHHRHTLSSWLEKYESGGLEELLKRDVPGGNPPSVSDSLKELLEERLNENGFSSYKEAHEFMQDHGYISGYDAASNYLKKYHETRLKTSRPQHIKQDPEAREAFKKTLLSKSKKPSPIITQEK